MEIKCTIQGLLIYQTLIFYGLGLLLWSVKFKKYALFVYTIAFTTAIVSLVYRGLSVQHFPLQNMFEVFLFLGALPFPLSLLSKKFFQIDDFGFDILTGIIILFPAGFVFSGQDQHLPPALQSVFFVPHVLA